jgi:hypothetical protein
VELLQTIRTFETAAMNAAQAHVEMEHLLHGGMYSRTARVKAGTVITGALIKRATVLIVQGDALMLMNGGFAELSGYNVFAASAGRKQVFVARGDVTITMIFPSAGTTVQDAEAEFTDETDLLLTRREGEPRA